MFDFVFNLNVEIFLNENSLSFSNLSGNDTRVILLKQTRKYSEETNYSNNAGKQINYFLTEYLQFMTSQEVGISRWYVYCIKVINSFVTVTLCKVGFLLIHGCELSRISGNWFPNMNTRFSYIPDTDTPGSWEYILLDQSIFRISMGCIWSLLN